MLNSVIQPVRSSKNEGLLPIQIESPILLMDGKRPSGLLELLNFGFSLDMVGLRRFELLWICKPKYSTLLDWYFTHYHVGCIKTVFALLFFPTPLSGHQYSGLKAVAKLASPSFGRTLERSMYATCIKLRDIPHVQTRLWPSIKREPVDKRLIPVIANLNGLGLDLGIDTWFISCWEPVIWQNA